jgi:hypothetical protein
VLHTFEIYNIYPVLDTFTIKDNKIQYVQYIQGSQDTNRSYYFILHRKYLYHLLLSVISDSYITSGWYYYYHLNVLRIIHVITYCWRRPDALYPQEDTWYSFLLDAQSTTGPQCGWKD